MKLTKTSYRKINDDKYEILVTNDFDIANELIGYVYRTISIKNGIKWHLKVFFMSLLDDHLKLSKYYDDPIVGGRVIATTWLDVQNAMTLEKETQEYDMRDLFGTD